MLVLKEVMDGHIPLNDELIDTLFQCTTCANCEQNCPSGVNVPEIIKTVRRDMVHVGACHPAFATMNDVLKKHNNIYGEDEPPDFARERNRKAEVAYFVGCVGSYREDEPTMEILDMLDQLGVDYTLIDEVCCSGVLEDMGYKINDALSHKNIARILATGAETVITGCPYCFRIFNNKPQYAGLREERIRIVHISQFLKDFDFDVNTDKVVTYHDPCDLGRHCGIYEEPRETIRKVAPNFVEMPHHHADAFCCGAGGGVRGAYPANSIAMARRRLKEAEQVGAQVILTECNACLHNLSNAKLRSQKFKIYNVAQFIKRLMEKAS